MVAETLHAVGFCVGTGRTPWRSLRAGVDINLQVTFRARTDRLWRHHLQRMLKISLAPVPAAARPARHLPAPHTRLTPCYESRQQLTLAFKAAACELECAGSQAPAKLASSSGSAAVWGADLSVPKKNRAP